jgi:hypothetical protein
MMLMTFTDNKNFRGVSPFGLDVSGETRPAMYTQKTAESKDITRN